MEKKNKIFKIYSDNFKYLKDSEVFTSREEAEYGCFCPLCLEYFTESMAFKTNEKNFLTIEHNPPNSLGGKGTILTCKKCNSINGNKIDKELLNFLENIDSRNLKPNSKLNTKITNNSINGNKLNAELRYDENGNFFFHIDKKRNNPSIYKPFFDSTSYYYKSSKFTSDIKNSGLRGKINFNLELPSNELNSYAKTCLLKIAYLIAFEKLGHIFIFNHNLDPIREQIKNPDKEIIINKQFFTINDVNEKILGVNVVCEPKELVSFLISFKLKTKSDSYIFGVHLPGFTDNNIKIYDNLEAFHGKTDLILNNFFNTEFDVKVPEDALIPYILWKRHI